MSRHLLADRVYQIYGPEVADLSLGARDGAEERGDHWNHTVVLPVLGNLAMGEIHALGQAGVTHLLFASLHSNSVEAFVHKEQECDFHETGRSQDVADIKDPVKSMDIGVAVGDPDVQSRSNHHNGHLERQEVSFEKTVEEVEDALPVGLLESVVSHIREGPILSRWSLNVDLAFRHVNVGGATQGTVNGAERPRSVFPVLPELYHLAHSITGIQSTPHVPDGLLVSGLDIGNHALVAAAGTTCDVALADGADDSSHGQVTVEGKEALEVHMQILANGFRIAVPSSDTVDQFQGDGVDRGWGSNCRATVQTGQTSGGPQDVGNTDQGRDAVRITVEDDWRGVQGRVGGVGVRQVHGSEVGEVVGRQMAVSCRHRVLVYHVSSMQPPKTPSAAEGRVDWTTYHQFQ